MSQGKTSDELRLSLGKGEVLPESALEDGGVKMDNSAKSDQKLCYPYIARSRGFSIKTGRVARFLAKKRDTIDASLQERGRLEFEKTASRKRAELLSG